MNTAEDGILALVRAVKICGTKSELGRRINVDSRHIWSWIYRDGRVPFEQVPFIVDAVRHEAVTPETLRPDFAEGWKLLAKQLANMSADAVV